MRKKLLSIFTAVVLTVSMAACGKGSGADNVDKDKSKSVGEEVTLSVMAPEGCQARAWAVSASREQARP